MTERSGPQRSCQSRQAVENEASSDSYVEARASSKHGDLDASVGRIHLLLRDAVPFMTEQDDRALSCRLEPRQRDGALGNLDGHDPPAVSALLVDPSLLAGPHPMDARAAARPKRVPVGKRLAVVRGIGNRDARADGVAGA